MNNAIPCLSRHFPAIMLDNSFSVASKLFECVNTKISFNGLDIRHTKTMPIILDAESTKRTLF